MNVVKRIITAVIVVAVFSGSLVFASAPEESDIQWSQPVKIYTPDGGGAYYPRPLLQKNGNIMIAFDTDEDTYGITSVKAILSEDGGKTFGKPVIVAAEDGVTCATPQLFEDNDGKIWCSYRTSEKVAEDWHTSIRVRVSSDGGLTFEELPQGYIVDETVTKERYGGIWEPHVGLMNGKIALMYCDDSDRTGTQGAYQNIILRVWEENGWSEPVNVSAPGDSRDGMPVWTQLQDGRYICVFESTDVTPAGFGIKYKISENGSVWGNERNVVDTPAPGKVDNAPYISVLSDGRLLCTFQSDEENSKTLGELGSKAYAMEGRLEGNTVRWEEKYQLFPVDDSRWSTMVSTLNLDNGTVLAFCTSNEPEHGLYMKTGRYVGTAEAFEQPEMNRVNNTLAVILGGAMLALIVCVFILILHLLKYEKK